MHQFPPAALEDRRPSKKTMGSRSGKRDEGRLARHTQRPTMSLRTLMHACLDPLLSRSMELSGSAPTHFHRTDFEAGVDSRSPTIGAMFLVIAKCTPGVAFAGIRSVLGDLGAWLMTFGAAGLFGVALLDSALVPLPSGPDLLMVSLTSLSPGWMPVYAIAATVGSTIGCAILYSIARKAGETALKAVTPSTRARVENLLGRYDMLTVIAAALLPPPFPFKPFVLGAGVLKLKAGRFVAAIAIGRAIRFFFEGWLALEFGDDALRLIKEHGLKVLIGVAAILLVTLIVRALVHRRERSKAEAGD